LPAHADGHRGETEFAYQPPGGPPDIASPDIRLEAWHSLPPETVAARLGVDPARGLDTAEAAARLGRFGPNAIERRARRGWPQMLAAQFTDFMILLLIAAAILSGTIGEWQDALVILLIVVVNAIIGFVQEWRAERAMAALQRMAAATATVLRDGQAASVPAAALVPGDVVLVEAGNVVPADLRLLDVTQLTVGEAALTGESVPVPKTVAALDDAALPLGDRHNTAFKGTQVLFGHGRGVVVATGMATELGRIAAMLEDAGETRTPLQHRLARLGRQLALGALAICVLIFALGLLRGEAPLMMLLTAVSLAVAAIPEALPAVVTVLLALGARRMAREQALIRRLPAVETLGSVTTICSDKTGTLTQNVMRATAAFVAGAEIPADALDPARTETAALLHAMALCTSVTAGADGGPRGEPTELALWQAAAARIDAAALAAQAPKLAELPFDSARKRMTTLHADGGGMVAYVKGAPEMVLPLCRDPASRFQSAAEAEAEAERMAAGGLRVLAFARRRWPAPPPAVTVEAVERDLDLLGLVGLIDPPRPEAKAAVATCRAAGITPVMITGDHPATARAIGQALGILGADGAVLTGRALAALPEEELRQRVGDVRVYARVDPAQKIRIVAALQAAGEVVAMTGDGVNDAPALARAEIGVAMGRGGTDVAREAASLVLLDDNFATIVSAVREGRRIYDNIRKFVRYVVTCNSAEILTILVAPFLGLPLPLLPIQILWINLVTDGLPGLALAAEPAERDVMRRPPRPPREGLFTGELARHVVLGGILMAAVTLLAQGWAIGAGLAHWQTVPFTVLTFAQMAQALAIRSERESLFRQGVFSNPALLGAVALTILLQLAVIYLPPLNPLFGTAALSAGELAVCFGLAALVFVAGEIGKFLARRHARSDGWGDAARV